MLTLAGTDFRKRVVHVLPFRVQFTEEDITDLRERLARARWPEAETVTDWSQGVPLAYLQSLCNYWGRDYDPRAAEARLNAFPQFRTDIDGVQIHFVHAESPHPNALPLIMTHGWPGSVVEFQKVIGPLTDPVAYGGDAGDAFHVVCPSLPGYGFSDKPSEAGWDLARIARAWTTLMAELGYDRYGAQGGDWGAGVTDHMGRHPNDHLVGIHLNLPVAGMADPQTDAERAAVASMVNYLEWESGYQKEQSTRPQTLGYALVDSPVGQCAWIVEKFRAWTDCDGDPENIFTREELLDNVMLYWIPGTGASSARLYWESGREPYDEPIDVPTGCSIFAKETLRLSRRWAEQRFSDIRYWNELDRGGHFAAFEQPELFVGEVRAFFRLVR